MAAGSGSGPSGDVTVWCTNSFVIGAYFWLFLRIDSSAPHWARVMTGGSTALGLVLTVVVVVDEEPEPRVVVVVDEDEDDEEEDEAAFALRWPPPSPPSAVVLVVVVVEEEEVEEEEEDDDGTTVATLRGRGPWTVSMARISRSRASPAARTWAWVAPWARMRSDITGPPPSDARSSSARSSRQLLQTPSGPARRTATVADSLPVQRTPRCESGNGLSTTGPGAGGIAGPPTVAATAARWAVTPAGTTAKRVFGSPWAMRMGASTAKAATAATALTRAAAGSRRDGDANVMRSLSRHAGGASDSWGTTLRGGQPEWGDRLGQTCAVREPRPAPGPH